MKPAGWRSYIAQDEDIVLLKRRNSPIGHWVFNESRRGKVSQVVRIKKTDVEVSFPVLVLLGSFFYVFIR
jgi:hypothetical protein